jgi:hypothetical protein
MRDKAKHPSESRWEWESDADGLNTARFHKLDINVKAWRWPVGVGRVCGPIFIRNWILDSLYHGDSMGR